MIEYLEKQNVDKNLIKQVEIYREKNGLLDDPRVSEPEFKYYCK